MTQDSVRPAQDLSTVRARRANLRRACQDLEVSLAAPLAGRAEEWSRQVTPALTRLHEAFEIHVSITEGPEGLFAQVRTDAPRLDASMRRLRREHSEISARLAATLADVSTPDESVLETVRTQLTAVLASLSSHRQRGADLVYQAYQVDIGGE